MTVKIEFSNGTSITFTNVQSFTDDGKFIKFTGVETPPGNVSTEETFDWEDVRRVSKQNNEGTK